MKPIAVGLILAVSSGPTAWANDSTIPDIGTSTLPQSTGTPGYGKPIRMPRPPQNPYMAPNPFNNVHNDSWLTDTARITGPSGADPVQRSNTMASIRVNPASGMFVCGTLTIDRHGHIVTPCVGPGDDTLVVLDPDTLEVLAYKHIPPATNELASYGSAYTFLDSKQRINLTVGDHIEVYAERRGAAGLTLKKVADYDLSAAVPEGDAIQSAMPDWRGRLWFLIQNAGDVGVYDPATKKLRTLHLGGQLTNSFAVNRSSAYIVSTKRMYRIRAGDDGRPRIVWAAKPYRNIGTVKPGQKSAGSGTSPTLLARGRYVAINDNADQMHVVVYRTRPDAKRMVCSAPVFPKGRGASENSVIAWNRSMVIQNTYGYDISQGLDSPPTQPGLARVVVRKNGKGCRVAWSNDTVRIPSVLGKVSVPTGMLYTMTREDDPFTDAAVYYWAGIDMATGAVRWQQRAGVGNQWDSYVPAAAIGPGGSVYVGLYGGIASLSQG